MAAEPTDLELVRQARREDGGKAFETLVERYQRPLYNFLLRSLRNGSLAEDYFQELFLRCFRGLPEFDAEMPGANFRAWLYRIAIHLVRDEQRKPQFRRALELEMELGLDAEADAPPDPENQAAWAQQRARVRRAVTALPDLSREVVVLNLYQGLSYPEMAQVLGVPLGTVKSRMHAALEKLRLVLVHDGDEAAGITEVAS